MLYNFVLYSSLLILYISYIFNLCPEIRTTYGPKDTVFCNLSIYSKHHSLAAPLQQWQALEGKGIPNSIVTVCSAHLCYQIYPKDRTCPIWRQRFLLQTAFNSETSQRCPKVLRSDADNYPLKIAIRCVNYKAVTYFIHILFSNVKLLRKC